MCSVIARSERPYSPAIEERGTWVIEYTMCWRPRGIEGMDSISDQRVRRHVQRHVGRRSVPGGFNYIPAKMPHQAWTSEGSVVFITVDAAWDVNWVGKPPSKTDLDRRLLRVQSNGAPLTDIRDSDNSGRVTGNFSLILWGEVYRQTGNY